MSGEIGITIFHTNDIHGNLELMPALSSFARRSRVQAAGEGRVVYLWDAGDAADRRRLICSTTKGSGFYPIMNAMGYDLQTMGNAISLPYGPQAMEQVAARAKFPILAANCRDGDGPLPTGLREYEVLRIGGGLRMGVIGLTSEWGGLYADFGLHFPDMMETAQRLVKELRQLDVSIVAVLSHLGLESDRQLAVGVNDIDLIVGGHSHDLLPKGEMIGKTLIAHAGEFGMHLGRVDLQVEARSGEIMARQAQVMEVPIDEGEDPEVLAAIDQAQKEVAALRARHIGILTDTLDLDHYRDCGIGRWAADALRTHLSADVAILASGHFHAGLPKGEVTYGDLNQACFSSANPALSSVSGAQIVAALEKGLDRSHTGQEPGGFRGTPIGIPQISGIRVSFDVQAKPGDRIRQVWVQGQELAPSVNYLLAHTDAEIDDDVGYLGLRSDQRPELDTPTILPEVLEVYLRDNSPVSAPAEPRWTPAG
jgi:2',3'-cyclic-nucleotide 2'-phosphodiesterase (5'-nucleotidase family)